MMLDALLYSLSGLAVGALIFKGKIPMGYCSGFAGAWSMRGHVEHM